MRELIGRWTNPTWLLLVSHRDASVHTTTLGSQIANIILFPVYFNFQFSTGRRGIYFIEGDFQIICVSYISDLKRKYFRKVYLLLILQESFWLIKQLKRNLGRKLKVIKRAVWAVSFHSNHKNKNKSGKCGRADSLAGHHTDFH